MLPPSRILRSAANLRRDLSPKGGETRSGIREQVRSGLSLGSDATEISETVFTWEHLNFLLPKH